MRPDIKQDVPAKQPRGRKSEQSPRSRDEAEANFSTKVAHEGLYSTLGPGKDFSKFDSKFACARSV